MVNIIHWLDIDGQRSMVTFFAQLTNEFPIFDFALTDPNLQFFLAGVAQLHMMDVFQQAIDVSTGMGTANVVTWIERQA